ncbi:YceI family protein [Deinococcus sp.]|uniref:YceI family protein n=1 Tax=Deinococcus sp. TaxID=47478 RepID=UPI00286994B6|nr:YceI family protein [Deinococcus sp.]
MTSLIATAPRSFPALLQRRSVRIGLGLAALSLGAAAIGLNAYLGAGPQPITVTDASGAATFNFRVTGIPVPGQLGEVHPQLTFDPRHLGATTGSVTVDLTKLNTGIALRDRHARNFIGAPAHPQATFTVTSVIGLNTIRPGQTISGTVAGQLDLNGVSVPLNAPITLTYPQGDPVITVKTAFNVVFKDHHITIPGADPQTDVKVEFRLPARF